MKDKIVRLQNQLLGMARYADVLLAVAVILILSMMILPIPPLVLDLLLATNLSFSILLLVVAMYVPNILAFSTFPSLLLITTLFRLGLNITTTRLILLEAHAGDIIFTFGNFVVGGNFAVGVVIFLILTIVQFIVVTKGAERVAEVSARFTLDAMPGKQMSVDADLRSGNIDQAEAKHRRSDLERESQLHGAMDGAMKFVKGDAIAGLIITAINILAGITIGVMQRGMEATKAISTYSILTIGDGLVSQIPSLLISITAGMIVTRGAGETDSTLGGDVVKQLISQPKALFIAGGFMFAFGLIPGFPPVPFLVLGTVAVGAGFAIRRRDEAVAPKDKRDLPAMAPAVQKVSIKRKDAGDEFSVTVPLLMDVAAASQSSVDAEAMNDELIRVRQALYHDLGVPFPGIHLRFNEGLAVNQYRILLHEVPIAEGAFRPGHVIAREKAETLKMLKINFTEDKVFLAGLKPLWVSQDLLPELTKARIQVLQPTQVLTYHLSVILKRYAGDFIGLQETKYLLEKMEVQFPEVVREVQRVLPVQKIAEVLQRLVQEEISIRNLRTILQALIDWGQKEKEAVLLVEYVRSSLRRYISYKFSRGQNMIAAYLLEPDVEEKIRKAIRQTSSGAYLALEPASIRKLLQSVRKEVGNLWESNQRPALLTSMDVRRYTRKLIEQEFYELPVLSHQELTEEITIQPLGRISM